MRRVATAVVVAVLLVVPLLPAPASAKAPWEVLVHRIGWTSEGDSWAVLVRDSDAMTWFASVFWSEPTSSEPSLGETLRYSYVIYLGTGAGPVWESEFRYFYAPTLPSDPGYFFTLTDIEGPGGTSETVTRVFHHPELDALVLPYALPPSGKAVPTAWLSVGNSVDPAPPTIICSSVQTCPEAEGPNYVAPLLVTGSVMGLALLGAFALSRRIGNRPQGRTAGRP